MYWGAQRGFAGAILDDETLRRTLPRQLMMLYASVSAVEGLDAELHLSHFKFGWVENAKAAFVSFSLHFPQNQ